MSHTRILDKIGQRFVNLPSAESRSKPFLEDAAKIGQRFVKLPSVELGRKSSLENAANTRKSHNKDRQESGFYCKAFVDVSTEVITQFFE